MTSTSRRSAAPDLSADLEWPLATHAAEHGERTASERRGEGSRLHDLGGAALGGHGASGRCFAAHPVCQRPGAVLVLGPEHHELPAVDAGNALVPELLGELFGVGAGPAANPHLVLRIALSLRFASLLLHQLSVLRGALGVGVRERLVPGAPLPPGETPEPGLAAATAAARGCPAL